MQFLNDLVNQINALVWGPPILVLILGTGIARTNLVPTVKSAPSKR